MGTVLVLFLGLGGVVFVLWVLRQLRGGVGGGSHSASDDGGFVPFTGDAGSSISPHHHGHHPGAGHCDCGHAHGDAAASDAGGSGNSAGGDGGSGGD